MKKIKVEKKWLLKLRCVFPLGLNNSSSSDNLIEEYITAFVGFKFPALTRKPTKYFQNYVNKLNACLCQNLFLMHLNFFFKINLRILLTSPEYPFLSLKKKSFQKKLLV